MTKRMMSDGDYIKALEQDVERLQFELEDLRRLRDADAAYCESRVRRLLGLPIGVSQLPPHERISFGSLLTMLADELRSLRKQLREAEEEHARMQSRIEELSQ